MSSVARIARYLARDGIHHGRLADEGLVRWSAAPWQGGRELATVDPRDAVRLLAPVTPTKIVCVGLNYREHIAESQSVLPGAAAPAEPFLFLKPPSAVVGPGEPIRLPPGVTRMDPEGEMGVVIGRRARAVDESEALGHVAGLTCFNDVSARNYQKTDGQWARAKGFDSFAPIGPWVALGLDPSARGVECRVNGARRTFGNTRDLLFPVPVLIAHISRIMTLEPGDVIATGTPAGVAPIAIGDRVEVEVEGVGVLENPVAAWA